VIGRSAWRSGSGSDVQPRGAQNTQRLTISDHDTTKTALFQIDYNHAFSAAGGHLVKGGFGVRHTTNDVDLSYPGGYVLLDRRKRTIKRRRTKPCSVAGLVTSWHTDQGKSLGIPHQCTRFGTEELAKIEHPDVSQRHVGK
jgi:hypothetical protein